MLRNITSIISTFVRIFSMLGVIFNCAQAVNTSLHKSLLEHCRRKCSTVSTDVLHSGHLSDSTTFIMARYSLTQHFPRRSLEIMTSLFRFLCPYLIFKETVTRAQLLPRMADRTRAVRLCLHRRCVEYLATGNFYLLA